MKLLLFDLDQTLVNTGGAGLRALNRACQRLFQIDDAMAGITPHGKTDPAIIREILTVRLAHPAVNGQIGRILDSYLFFLREEVVASTTYRVLPGIRQILQEMAAREDVSLGLATGNIEAGARIKLEPGHLNPFFPFGGFGSDSEDRTELVRRAVEKSGQVIPAAGVFVIGDTPLDIDAGRQSGFNTVGVATGTYSMDQLLAAGATFAIEDFERGREQFLKRVLA